MKKLIGVLLVLCMVFVFAACTQPVEQPAAQDTPAEPAEAFPGKIAVVTSAVDQNEEEYHSAQMLVAKYGADKIIHVTWPTGFMQGHDQIITIFGRLAGDPEIKGLVVNQAIPGTMAAVDKLLETRDDIFICVVQPQENPPDVSAKVNMILYLDELNYGPMIIQQANTMGAKTFVHYSFPRHMSRFLLSGRRDLMKAECEKLGIEFVDATAPDPISDVGVVGAQQFILEDVPKMVAQYGKDTAFFSTNCSMQIPLITSALDEGAIYPMPCCPSPYHGYPGALDIKFFEVFEVDGEMMPVDEIISETAKILKEKGVLGRFSTTSVPIAIMNTNVGAEYAIKWIKGEVPTEKGVVDIGVVGQLMKDFSGSDATLSAYEENGVTYDNFILVLLDLFTYSEADIK